MFLVCSAGAMLQSSPSAADGALAIGLPPDVARDGFIFGFVTNGSSSEEARAAALEECRKPDPTKPSAILPLCTIVESFRDQCVAVAMEFPAGTPGVGWAVAPNLRQAEAAALNKCKATAKLGGRRYGCTVTDTGCDGAAKAPSTRRF